MVFLVIFDVRDEARRKELIEVIAHYGDSIELSKTAFGLASNQSLRDIHEGLRLHLKSEDQLIVLPIARPYTGGDQRVKQWMDKNLSKD